MAVLNPIGFNNLNAISDFHREQDSVHGITNPDLLQQAIGKSGVLRRFVEKIGYTVVKTNDCLLTHDPEFGFLIWLADVPEKS